MRREEIALDHGGARRDAAGRAAAGGQFVDAFAEPCSDGTKASRTTASSAAGVDACKMGRQHSAEQRLNSSSWRSSETLDQPQPVYGGDARLATRRWCSSPDGSYGCRLFGTAGRTTLVLRSDLTREQAAHGQPELTGPG